jgi:hypothetical protein
VGVVGSCRFLAASPKVGPAASSVLPISFT